MMRLMGMNTMMEVKKRLVGGIIVHQIIIEIIVQDKGGRPEQPPEQTRIMAHHPSVCQLIECRNNHRSYYLPFATFEAWSP